MDADSRVMPYEREDETERRTKVGELFEGKASLVL
jgi:hypothetical protein